MTKISYANVFALVKLIVLALQLSTPIVGFSFNGLAHKVSVDNIKMFSNEELPERQKNNSKTDDDDQDTSKQEFDDIEYLGRVQRLDVRNFKHAFEPKKPDSLGTAFRLWTKQRNKVDFEVSQWIKFETNKHNNHVYDLNLLSSECKRLNFNINKKLVVSIPGYLHTDSSKSENNLYASWTANVSQIWVEQSDEDNNINAIQVQWPQGAGSSIYWQSAANTKFVGRQVTMFLYYLAKLHSTSLKDDKFLANIHLVGHSLGAHIAGFVGRDLAGKVSRLTGLDPAGPWFDNKDNTNGRRLSKTDAKFVETIMSNSGRMRILYLVKNFLVDKLTFNALYSQAAKLDSSFGTLLNLGHLNYLANSGSMQPGCDKERVPICDHNRAVDIYISLLESRSNQNQLAFSTNSFNQILDGTHFSQDKNCAWSDLDHKSLESNSSCVAPLNPVMETGAFLNELEKKYKINVYDKGINDRQFFFITGSSLPYLMGNYLILVKLARNAEQKWADNCRLKLNVHVGKNKGLIELPEMSIIWKSESGFSGLAALVTSQQLEQASRQKQLGSLRSVEAIQSFNSLLPTHISAKVSRYATCFKDKIFDFAKSDEKKELICARQCSLSVESVIVVPVLKSKLKLAGIYTLDDQVSKMSDDNANSIKVYRRKAVDKTMAQVLYEQSDKLYQFDNMINSTVDEMASTSSVDFNKASDRKILLESVTQYSDKNEDEDEGYESEDEDENSIFDISILNNEFEHDNGIESGKLNKIPSTQWSIFPNKQKNKDKDKQVDKKTKETNLRLRIATLFD